MVLLSQRVALSALLAAAHLALSRAFLPSASLSSSAWTNRPGSRSTLASRGHHARGGASVVRGREATAMNGGKHDLYVVGAGYLGKIIGAVWNSKHPEAEMYGETRSYTRHENFMPPGMSHRMRKNRDDKEIKCPNVVFCANPGGNKDYALEVFRAMEEVWDGTGMFVFTSSGSVYAEKKGGVVTEDSPIDEAKVDSPLRIAEKVVLRGGGCVVRLAGLYSIERGPHTVWLNEKRLNHHSQGMVNLVSYEDAAFAVVAALDAGIAEIDGESGAAPEIKGKVFLAADHAPATRRKICEVALGHPLYARKSMPRFTQDASPPEFAETGAKKVYDSSETRRVLGWEPQCSSMEEYFRVAMEQELAARE